MSIHVPILSLGLATYIAVRSEDQVRELEQYLETGSVRVLGGVSGVCGQYPR